MKRLLSILILVIFIIESINLSNIAIFAATPQENIVSIALNEVGTTERSAGSDDTKYNDWYYGKRTPGVQWCAIFVCWCANQAGISTSIIPKTAACATMKNKMVASGAVQHLRSSGYTPQKGDIIFFDYGKGIHHVGIVNYCKNGYVHYIDGNNIDHTPHWVSDSKKTLTNSSIWGYVTPQYIDVPQPPVFKSYTNLKDTSLTLTWNKVSNATSYKLEYRKADTEWSSAKSATVTSNSANVTGLEAGKLYWFRVYAINGSGTSSASDSYGVYLKNPPKV